MSKNVKEIWKVVKNASELNIGDRIRYSDTRMVDCKFGFTFDDTRFVLAIFLNDNMVQSCDINGSLTHDDIFNRDQWDKVEVCVNNKINPDFLTEEEQEEIRGSKKTKSVTVLIHVNNPKSKNVQNAWFEIIGQLSTIELKITSENIYSRKYDCIKAAKKACKDLGISATFEIINY